MTYRCSTCSHDYSEHDTGAAGQPWPCDVEDCECPNYEEA